jgi:hypothetical protein
VLVRFQFPPAVDGTIVYQQYYLLGLEERARLRIERAPLAVRLAPGVRNKVRAVHGRNKMRAAARFGEGSAQGHVARYVADFDGRTVRFAIDAHDARAIRDAEALDWADAYFKSNRWPGDVHPPNVLPLVNGNGLLDGGKLRWLRRLRGVKKTIDVAYIANVWGGREHTLRIFERLADLDCSTDLLAIFPGLELPDDKAIMERLRARGIPMTRDALAPKELWGRLARARVVALRAGKHLCFSWRTLDLLSMGACILFDALPPPRWPVPLEPGVHVADCGIERPEDTGPALDAEYDKLGAGIERLLGAPEEQRRLRSAAAEYFDQHAAPGQVAEWMLSRLTPS